MINIQIHEFEDPRKPVWIVKVNVAGYDLSTKFDTKEAAFLAVDKICKALSLTRVDLPS